MVKANGLQLSFSMFRYTSVWYIIKINFIKLWTIDPGIFDYLEKGLVIVSSPCFVPDFSRKMFLMFYFIN